MHRTTCHQHSIRALIRTRNRAVIDRSVITRMFFEILRVIIGKTHLYIYMVVPNAYRHHWVAMATSARTASTDIHWPPQTHQALKKKITIEIPRHNLIE